MKKILVLFLIGIFIIAINLSIKIFNTFDAWLGIIIGVISIVGMLSLLYLGIKSMLK